MPKPQPVVVYWLDAETDDGWKHETDSTWVSPPLVRSYGEIIKRNKRHLVLAGCVSFRTPADVHGKRDNNRRLIIPLGMIQKVLRVNEGDPVPWGKPD